MAYGRLRRRRRLATAALAIVTTVVSGGLIWLIYVALSEGLQVAAGWAQIGSLILAILALTRVVAGLVHWWRQVEPTFAPTPTADQIDHAHRTLAEVVLGQWREEISVRQLDQPTPLAVRWHLTELPVMDRHDLTFRDHHRHSPLRALLGRGRLRFSGRSDRIAELAEEFQRLPRQRLVILGDPGMGKTTLALLLLRELLRQREPSSPIPVLLAISDWRPSEERLRDWLARRITETYPALRAAEFGPDVARAMIAQRRILPVLDGLDELPGDLRPDALDALNAATTADDPLIITCRTAEYEAAIVRPGGVALTGGVVIEPDPLRPGDLTTYLRGCLPDHPAGGWPHLLAALTDRRAPVTRALATPLDLWLLRKVYVDTGADPRELLDTDRFPTAGDISDHLLDHLVHATITANSPDHDLDRPPAFRTYRAWDPDAAKHWLGYFADHLRATKDHDIAWWRLHETVSSVGTTYKLIGGLALGTGYGLASGLIAALIGALAGQATAAFLGGMVSGLMGGLLLAFTSELTAEPAHANLRLRGRTWMFLRKVSGRMAMGAVIGLMPAVTAALGYVPGMALAEIGLIGGALAGLLVGVVEWATTPQPGDLARTPADTLRRDLQLMLGRTALGLLGIGSIVGLSAGLVGQLVIVFVLAVMAVVAVLVNYGPARFNGTASSIYLVGVLFLRLQRNAPLRLMRFLDDAHQIGLLRQVGPVYQFRHAKLQDRLALTFHPHA